MLKIFVLKEGFCLCYKSVSLTIGYNNTNNTNTRLEIKMCK